jgi:hypothetical protein
MFQASQLVAFGNMRIMRFITGDMNNLSCFLLKYSGMIAVCTKGRVLPGPKALFIGGFGRHIKTMQGCRQARSAP